jgi:cyanophycinase
LKEVARRVAGGRLVIATIASSAPEGYYSQYRAVFADLGVTDTCELYVDERAETFDPDRAACLTDAAGIFFTGGDQLRIASQIGDTPIERMVRALHARGGVIAGTSAGASAMGETMLVAGSNTDSPRIGDIRVAPGLALLGDVIIDQHFAERGRIGRLLGAVAQNPRMLGIGIDEDTAVVIEKEQLRVIGAGGVTVVDAAGVTHSNIAEARPDRALSMHGVTLHVLSAGDRFSLAERRPAVER